MLLLLRALWHKMIVLFWSSKSLDGRPFLRSARMYLIQILSKLFDQIFHICWPDTTSESLRPGQIQIFSFHLSHGCQVGYQCLCIIRSSPEIIYPIFGESKFNRQSSGGNLNLQCASEVLAMFLEVELIILFWAPEWRPPQGGTCRLLFLLLQRIITMGLELQ